MEKTPTTETTIPPKLEVSTLAEQKEYWISEHRKCKTDVLQADSYEQQCDRLWAYIICNHTARVSAPKLFEKEDVLDDDFRAHRIFDHGQKYFRYHSEKEYQTYTSLLVRMMKTIDKFSGNWSVDPFETLICWSISQNALLCEDGSHGDKRLLDSILSELEEYTTSIKVWMTIGNLYSEEHRYASALRLFSRITSVSQTGSNYETAMVKSCEAWIALGYFDRAFDYISKVKEQCPFDFANYARDHIKDYALAKRYYAMSLRVDAERRFLLMAEDHPDAFSYQEKMEFFDHFIVHAARQAYEINTTGSSKEMYLIESKECGYKNYIFLPRCVVYEIRNMVAADADKIEKTDRGLQEYSLVATGDMVKRILPNYQNISDWCYETAACFFIYKDNEKEHLIDNIKQSENSKEIISKIKRSFFGFASGCYKREYETYFGPLEKGADDFPFFSIPPTAPRWAIDAVSEAIIGSLNL
jgi:tetratricopeptide (TPR) repeat protein